uniref:Potassium channel domain-containing protein n=1 Tax=Plectus sambesii TaxID=2011161 RepID=A0A914V386_9BILA
MTVFMNNNERRRQNSVLRDSIRYKAHGGSLRDRDRDSKRLSLLLEENSPSNVAAAASPSSPSSPTDDERSSMLGGTNWPASRNKNLMPSTLDVDDRLMRNRPGSRYSCASSRGSKARLSIISLQNLEDDMLDQMLQRAAGDKLPGFAFERRRSTLSTPPDDFCGKMKFYYDKWGLRHVVPLLILILYSILGAALFYWVENENEQLLVANERKHLNALREEVFEKLRKVMSDELKSDEKKLYDSRDVLVWYEHQMKKIKMPEMLEWDIWGALFYVGAMYTTIGYGNIAPRTISGQALSIVYALIGIPLVLAILANFGNLFTKVASKYWIKYREWVNRVRGKDPDGKGKYTSAKGRRKSTGFAPPSRKPSKSPSRKPSRTIKTVVPVDLEAGIPGQVEEEEEEEESETIPVWLALFMCIGWMCACAGVFCLWETRWSYFKSFYFFFVSLSTIGLGDVVPDHPRMMILMFWLVIIGLSLVSMLISVIQIKIEEWLYQMMIKIQEEYQRALAMGDCPEKEEIMEKIMKKQPWLLRSMAPQLISEKQAAKIDHQLETFEKVVRPTNNKNIQTEQSIPIDPSPQSQQNDVDIQVGNSTDTLNTQASAPNLNEMSTQWSGRGRYSVESLNAQATAPSLNDISTQWSSNYSINDGAIPSSCSIPLFSVPEEPTAPLEDDMPFEELPFITASAMDENLLSKSNSISAISLPMDPSFDSDIDFVDRSMQADLIALIDQSSQADDLDNLLSITPVPHPVTIEERFVQTDAPFFETALHAQLIDRSMQSEEIDLARPERFVQTDAPFFETALHAQLIDRSMQSEEIDLAGPATPAAILSSTQGVQTDFEDDPAIEMINRSMQAEEWYQQVICNHNADNDSQVVQPTPELMDRSMETEEIFPPTAPTFAHDHQKLQLVNRSMETEDEPVQPPPDNQPARVELKDCGMETEREGPLLILAPEKFDQKPMLCDRSMETDASLTPPQQQPEEVVEEDKPGPFWRLKDRSMETQTEPGPSTNSQGIETDPPIVPLLAESSMVTDKEQPPLMHSRSIQSDDLLAMNSHLPDLINNSMQTESLHETMTTPTISDLRDCCTQSDPEPGPPEQSDQETQIVFNVSDDVTQTDERQFCDKAIQAIFHQQSQKSLEKRSSIFSRPKLLRQKSPSSGNVVLAENCTQCALPPDNSIDVSTQTIVDHVVIPLPAQRKITPKSTQPKTKRKPSTASMMATESVELGVQTDPFPVRKDLIMQTDDSYLKIARRLEQYRMNRTDSLHVCAAGPLSKRRVSRSRINPPSRLLDNSRSGSAGRPPPSPSSPASPSPTKLNINLAPDRPLYVSPVRRASRAAPTSPAPLGLPVRQISRSLSRQRSKNPFSFSPEAVDRTPVFVQRAEMEGGVAAKARSKSPYISQLEKGAPPTKVKRPAVRVPSKKVSEYIALHEKGFHSPATQSRKRVYEYI